MCLVVYYGGFAGDWSYFDGFHFFDCVLGICFDCLLFVLSLGLTIA